MGILAMALVVFGIALKRPAYVEDKDSGELRRPHHIDLKTGMYKGRQVLKRRRAKGRKRLSA